MKKYLQKKLNNEKGMTLIELLAVIVIIAIIAAIAIPAIGNIIENSRVGAIKSDALGIINAGELYFIDNPNETTVTLDLLKTQGFVDDTGSFTIAATPVVTVTKAKKATGTTSGTTATPTTISGVGKTGKIQVAFTNASKDNIEAYTNSTRGAGTNVNAGPAS